MYGLAVIEVMTLSGHLSDIDEIFEMSAEFFKFFRQNFVEKAAELS